MSKLITSALVCASIALAQLPLSAPAQAGAAAAEEKPKRKVQLPSPSVGKKVGKAFEAYSAEDIDGAIVILKDIDAKRDYDVAYVNYFTGQMYAMKAKGSEALPYIVKAIEPDILNEADHAGALRLAADLSSIEEDFANAIKYYYEWIAFTGKEDGDVYTRIAQAYVANKQLDKVIDPADKAIAAYGDKLNQNPYILKVTSYYERKMTKETIGLLEDMVQMFSSEKKWWVMLGQLYIMEEKYEKALATLDLAYKQGYLEKESEMKTLASLYAQSEMPYKSALILEKHIASGLIKRDDKNIASLANAWHAALDIDKAAKYYGELAKMTNLTKHYEKQAVLFKQDEQFKPAIVAYNKALEGGSKNKGTIYMGLAECHFYLGQYKEAHSAIVKAADYPKTKRAATSWASYIKETAQRKKVKI
ncbi:tetratricopeptide repeat protein [Thalassotalea fusca]